ncbi:hypothetical protein [Gluconacetobacter diazotrophicus]|uniref:hypothetical protein n=1 Tax=Gluconacetobacter diazotrophicus TaxID=33996 RepID=UPI0012FF3805|nr:hypothetical protein [Gluconacetobacter diazotrophicus]
MNDFSESMDKWRVINGSDPAILAAHLICRPHIAFKPTITVDGDKWCALYGENLQEGISGFGDTPAQACAAFDKAWRESLTPAASVARKGSAA